MAVPAGRLVLGVAALVLSSPGASVHAAAAGPDQVRVTVTSAQGTAPAPGQLTWTVRITNLTSAPLRDLSLGEQVVVAGDPGHGSTAPFAPGACGAAAGTAYCPLPTLQPGVTISRRGTADVPVHLAPGGPSTIGSRVETLEFVSTADGVVVSNEARLGVRIVRGGLPVTGLPARALLTLGLSAVAVGAFLTRKARRPLS